MKKEDLAHFTGSEHWYRYAGTKFTYTDGVAYVAEHGQAYWLISEILLAHALISEVRNQEFAVWKLTVSQDKSAMLACTDGNGAPVFSKRILFTDFPLPEIEFWFQNNVLYLPSEH